MTNTKKSGEVFCLIPHKYLSDFKLYYTTRIAAAVCSTLPQYCILCVHSTYMYLFKNSPPLHCFQLTVVSSIFKYNGPVFDFLAGFFAVTGVGAASFTTVKRPWPPMENPWALKQGVLNFQLLLIYFFLSTVGCKT